MKDLKDIINEAVSNRYDIYLHSKHKMIMVYDSNNVISDKLFKTIDEAVLAICNVDEHPDIHVIVGKSMPEYLFNRIKNKG